MAEAAGRRSVAGAACTFFVVVRGMRTDSRAVDWSGYTPRELGYHLPAEWQPHAATWLAWPHNRADWPGKFEPIPWIITDIIRHVASAEAVHLLLVNHAARRQAERLLRAAGVNTAAVRWHIQPTDRIWTRDSGPIFLCRAGAEVRPAVVFPRVHASLCPGVSASPRPRVAVSPRPSSLRRLPRLASVGWAFNAWAKYGDFHRDRHLPRFVAATLQLPLWEPAARDNRGRLRRIVLEGGSIDGNGAGCLLTTEECLLSHIQQRNPGIPREQIEKILCEYLGAEKVLWLQHGIAGDDTHGHIDDTARFAGENLILACREANRSDPNYAPLYENWERLRAMRDAWGRRFEVAALPMPRPVTFRGQRLPASYANFYVCNAGVLVPVFNDPADLAALRVMEQAFHGRTIIPIYCRDLVWGLGTLHCMTQQQPAI